jgi:hypothetical protein
MQAFGHGARMKITSARRVAISHFHCDECGAANEWLKLMRRRRGPSLGLIGAALKFLQKNFAKGAKVLESFER